MSNPPELLTYVAVFGGIALFTAMLTLVAVRARRSADAAALPLRAADVTAQRRDLLLGPDFLWAVWQNTASAGTMQILVRDARDEVLSTIEVAGIPLDGVLSRFEFADRHYEIRKAGPLSNRTQLREAGQDAVLLSAAHATFGTTFFRGDGPTQILTLPQRTVFHRYRPVEVDGQEVGKVIVGVKQTEWLRVLSLPANRFSILEQLFVLASV